MRGIFVVSAALALGGCATIVEGTSQTVAISTQPPGAACSVSRDGMQISAVISTPGSIKIDKSRKDLSITCTKDGYQTTTMNYSSSFNGMTFGNVILGGAVGAVVDASTGANYNYPKEVMVAMAQAPTAPVAAAPVVAPVAAAAPVAASAPAPVAAVTEKPAKAPKPAATAVASAAPVVKPVPEGTRMSTPIAD
jgi:hypothetical protein